MIYAIGTNSDINLAHLAEKMRVTKGAIPQIVKKLKKKKFISIIKDKKDNKTLRFSLTEKGTMAYKNQREFHKKMIKKILEKFSMKTDRDISIISRILIELNSILD